MTINHGTGGRTMVGNRGRMADEVDQLLAVQIRPSRKRAAESGKRLHRFAEFRLAFRSQRLRALRFAPDPLGNPHPELRLVAYRLRSRDPLCRNDLLGGQAQ